MPSQIENGVLMKYIPENDETVYEVPGSVREIGPGAFRNVRGDLRRVILPDTLEKISDFSLSGMRDCTGELIIPDSVTELGRGAFNGSAFRKIVIGRGVRVLPPFMCDGNMLLEEIVIPDTVEELCTSCLGAVRGMRSLRLPDSIRIIRRRALTGSDLFDPGKVNFPKKVELVEDLAFDGASGIREVTLSERVSAVWEGAFSGLPSLKRVCMPDSITEIGPRAFAYCRELEDVRLPAALRRIGQRAFSGDSSLKSISLPDGVREIGPMAFYACVGLEKVVLPESVELLGRDAFYHCASLREAVLPQRLSGAFEEAFTDCPALCSVRFTGGLE